MSTHRVEIPSKLIPVFVGEARFRCAKGGRGSAKTRSFAKMVCVRGAMFAAAGISGVILCAREFMNSLDDSSLAEVKAAIASDAWLQSVYEVGEKYVRTKDGLVELIFAGLRHNLASLKSKARILLCWVDEAEPVTDEAWSVLIPTVREDGSEIWVTWNPKKRGSATDKRFGSPTDPDIKLVEMNWRDNPFFPPVLEVERQRDLRDRPEQYDHIWEGGYVTALEGAYFAKQLAEARAEGRIGPLAKDPILPVKAFFDLGGSGANADAMAIWIVQWVGQAINVLDYIEGQGQVLSYYVSEMRKRGYEQAQIYLPHDGVASNSITGKRYEDHVRDAGFNDVRVIPNQGRGAAMMRIEATRRLFPKIWIDDRKCQAGLDALGWYHEKRDADRGIGLGPDHDWSSHAADAFGLMAICHAEHVGEPAKRRSRYSDDTSARGGAWAV